MRPAAGSATLAREEVEVRSRRARPESTGGGDGAATGCENCGARQTVAGAKHCAYCGVVLPRAPSTAAGPFGDIDARFAALRENPALDRLLAERPPAAAGVWPGLTFAGFGGLFATVAAFIWMRSRAMRAEFDAAWRSAGGRGGARGTEPFDAMAPLFIAIGVGIAVYGLFRLWRFRSAPWQSFPALVTREQTEVSGHGRSSRTTYHVTLQRESGRRSQVTTTANMARGIHTGDLGIAHVRDGMLLGFRRLHERA